MTAIIILNWNGADDTIACLCSLEKAQGSFFVVVADNGVEGDAGGGDGRFVFIEDAQFVPGNVSEGHANGLVKTAVFLCHSAEVSQRTPLEAFDMLFILHLRVRYGKERVVVFL